MDYRKLGATREEIGDRRFALSVVNLINEGNFPLDEFSLRGLWEACGSPNLERAAAMPSGRVSGEEGLFEAAASDSSAFPIITGQLINRMVQQAYDLEYGVADSLVTNIPSSRRDETIVGFTAEDGLREVGEGMDYEETSFGEKYHKIYNQKWGRLIALTAEMVKFDQTGQMMTRAQRIGEKARAKWEEIHFNAILEKASTGVKAAWRPAGTSTTLYSDTSTDPWSAQTFDNVQGNTLTDETDLDETQTLFSVARDEQGDYIQVSPDTLLVSPAKIHTALKILGSSASTQATYSSAVKNTFQGAYRAVSSPWVTSILGAAYWLLGAFRKQFVRTTVFPLQVFAARSGSEDEFKRDVIAQWKARFMIGVGAIDNKFVIRSTGAS